VGGGFEPPRETSPLSDFKSAANVALSRDGIAACARGVCRAGRETGRCGFLAVRARCYTAAMWRQGGALERPERDARGQVAVTVTVE